MSIWFLVAIIIPAVASVVPRGQKIMESTTQRHHFSVVWKGFSPSYGNQTPDYYICINDLNASTLQMNIALHIQNFENNSYYFMITQYQTPPTGWSITPYYVGQINVDQGLDFVYSNLAREKPSSIPQGEITETISLVVKAYYDSSYINLYSQDNFTVNFNFIDRLSTSWTIMQYNNFDDGTPQGWTCQTYHGYPIWGWVQDWQIQSYNIYRSWPNSIHTGDSNYLQKTFDTTGPFTESYLISAFYHNGAEDLTIYVNGSPAYKVDLARSGVTWYQYCIPLPLSRTVDVSINCFSGNLDDVYLIAR